MSLEPGLADEGALLMPLKSGAASSLARDLADLTEHDAGDRRRAGTRACDRALDDAREGGEPLADVVERVGAHVVLDRRSARRPACCHGDDRRDVARDRAARARAGRGRAGGSDAPVARRSSLGGSSSLTIATWVALRSSRAGSRRGRGCCRAAPGSGSCARRSPSPARRSACSSAPAGTRGGRR